MITENEVSYEAEQNTIRKTCKDNNLTATFDERYPFAVMYRVDPPVTLLDNQDESKERTEHLQIDVVIGSDTACTIKGEGTLPASVLRKLIKSAETCAETFFRLQAETTLQKGAQA